MIRAQDVSAAIQRYATKGRAKALQRFFKTGPGQYGEGDVFAGVRVPDTRKVAKEYADISLPETKKLLHSAVHEERLAALLILVEKYNKATDRERKKIIDLYLGNTKYINNWDLVDLSAGRILGRYLSDKSRRILYQLAQSEDLWKKRIAIIATSWFIKDGDISDTLRISKILLTDEHDLIHKAVGWMLRESAKQQLPQVEEFLRTHYSKLSRTTLRYAIERFPEKKRKQYLKGEFT